MKHLLITTIAAVVLVGCGESIPISIYEAAQNGNIEVLKRHLVNGVNVNEKGPFNASPLHIAVYNDHKEAAELLISKGADINSKGGGESYTPLMVAASNKRNDIAKMLISNGANINATAKDGTSALVVASQLNNIKLVKLLVSNNANIDFADKIGITPLHSATMNNNKDIVEFLVANKAAVNSKSKEGLHTPLFFASQKGYDKITKLLILNGAEVNLKDKRGNTPLDIAIFKKHPKTADLLRKHGAKTGEELKAAGN